MPDDAAPDSLTASSSVAERADTPRITLLEAAAQQLRLNIGSGRLPAGTVLQESALSERLSVSRATVKRALSLLEEEGLLRRFSGRGFMVEGDTAVPRRLDLRRIELDLDEMDEDLGKPNWQRIQDQMESDLHRCLVFGRYRLTEALVAQTFDVSRTVVRDVLSRLQERGLVQKTASSRWVVEPLTAQRIKDKFALREVLEVAALRSASPDIEALLALAERVRALPEVPAPTPEQWFALDREFLRLAILSTPNRDMAHYVSANRGALEASQRVLFSIGLPPDHQSLLEICMVIDLLRAGTMPAAANMLKTHLGNALQRTIAQLKIVSVIDPPSDLAPYLLPA